MGKGWRRLEREKNNIKLSKEINVAYDEVYVIICLQK